MSGPTKKSVWTYITSGHVKMDLTDIGPFKKPIFSSRMPCFTVTVFARYLIHPCVSSSDNLKLHCLN